MVEYVARNRVAGDLNLKEKFEAGLVLAGAEVKSCRAKNVRLEAAFVKVIGEEPFLFNLIVGRYGKSGRSPLPEDRPRKILLNRREIDRLSGLLSQKGMTAVPLKMYTANNLVKIEIGVGTVLRRYEKKEKLIRRQDLREAGRFLKG